MSEVESTDCCLAIWWIWLSGHKTMAGINAEQQHVMVRRLRGRDVAVVAPAAPSRSSAAAANVEKKAKAAPKRAAMDDASHRATSAAPAQHAKKRAALANLTNCSNFSVNNCANVQPQPSKSQVISQVAAAKTKLRAAFVAKEVELSVEKFLIWKEKQSKTAPSSGSYSSVSFQTDENTCPSRAFASVEVKPQVTDVISTGCTESKTLASLERKTQQNLYISKESKPVVKPVACLFGDDTEGEGWSGKNYMDIDCHKDPQMCSIYAAEIYHHLRMAELKRRLLPTFMEGMQQDINASMRSILVDWLVEVAEEYKLVPDTLYLTISYIDRFLSGNLVTRQRLQLLGVACMLIASKYEEICAPQVEDFCYITDNTYNREEVLNMEREVLNYLHFELTGPTTKSFLRRFVRAAHAGQKTPILQLEFLGNYLAELTLLEYSFLRYLPSMIAGAAVFLAKLTLDPTSKPWNTTLQHYSGYKPSELAECVKSIHELQRNTKNCTLPAIREKYRQHKFKCVATLSFPDAIPLEYFHDLI